MKNYLAHSPTTAHPEGQALKDHLEGVSELCAAFGQMFGAEADGRQSGLYHDIGKYSDAFQRRIGGSKEQVDHSSAGAMLLFEKRNLPAAMCIAGHHAGLSDIGTKNDLADSFMARINHARAGGIENCEAWRRELPEGIPVGGKNSLGLDTYFYTKMLFSALTDADWLDTEAYFENRPYAERTVGMDKLTKILDDYISRWKNPEGEINRRRCRILKSAVDRSTDAPGLFSMTVPTGGGKTISSMAFALHHASQHGKRRIIYVIPYCSILEQTQGVFDDIFGKGVITAHYSGAEYSAAENEEDRRVFSAENWEAPIILTTAVQFFESLYSNKPGKNRKLHNVAQSVIVFDEAQMLPVPFLRPCLGAICQLVQHYGCSAVLCTATQPALGPLLDKLLPGVSVRELCPDPENMYQAFRRVRYVDDGTLTDEELVSWLQRRRQALCVVNSRRQAQELYNALGTKEGSYHLSTLMTPDHRRNVLQEIRERLRSGQDCRVISTSLIEAGVDVDFPEVFRALAGLDSIIQSGGRCNREGKRPAGESLVHVFRTASKPPRTIEQNISAAEHTLRRFSQPDAPEAIYEYFRFLLYTLKPEQQLDREQILENAGKLRFQTVSDAFRLIDGADHTVYIPIGEGERLIEDLRQYGPDRRLLRQLGPYGVTVYRPHFVRLREMGALELVSENAGILLDLKLYSPDTGLSLEIEKQNQGIFI
ncbi:MAG: CRISPR-associated helicase Cas3' [Oscillospiraceae bacterium]|nr:CRISPR-associated helicase Cas3' [Oscillospiraceae bacterium]